jgi:hypothetical protein
MSSNGLIYAADSLDLALLLTQWRWGAHTQIQSAVPKITNNGTVGKCER